MFIVILLELEYISVALINKIIIVIKSSTRFFFIDQVPTFGLRNSRFKVVIHYNQELKHFKSRVAQMVVCGPLLLTSLLFETLFLYYLNNTFVFSEKKTTLTLLFQLKNIILEVKTRLIPSFTFLSFLITFTYYTYNLNIQYGLPLLYTFLSISIVFITGLLVLINSTFLVNFLFYHTFFFQSIPSFLYISFNFNAFCLPWYES